MEINLQFPSGPITIKYLRNFILDNHLTEQDVILVNSYNFEDLVLEHRTVFQEVISIPYYLIGVFIKEDRSGKTPKDKIVVVKHEDTK